MCYRPTWSGLILRRKTIFWDHSIEIMTSFGSGLEQREMRIAMGIVEFLMGLSVVGRTVPCKDPSFVKNLFPPPAEEGGLLLSGKFCPVHV